MRHPFAGVNKVETNHGQSMSRRGALGRMVFATAGVLGINAAARARELSTEAVGEEGGNAVAVALRKTTAAVGEEGGAVNNTPPTTEPFGEEAGKVTSWVVPGLEDGGQGPALPVDGRETTQKLGEEGGASTRALGEEGGKNPEDIERLKKQLEQLKQQQQQQLQLQAVPSTAAIGEEGGQAFGLIQVQPLARELQPQQLDQVWREMGDASAKGPQGCAMLYGSKQSIAFLSKHLDSKIAPADPQRVARLIAEMDHDDYHVRERATGELAALGMSALPAIEAAQRKTSSVEVQNRLRRMLDQAKDLPALLQLRRGFEVLVCLKTAEAKKVVEQLADARTATIVSAMARSALPRIK
ncbi:MAG: hypothetical protein AB7K24_08730 [Gemmataceae bacterium]